MVEDNVYEQQQDDEQSADQQERSPQKAEEESARVVSKTIATMKAGERIVECLEAADEQRRKWDEYHLARSKGISMEEPVPGAFYMALGRDKTPAEFLLAAVEKIPMPDVEEALLCLPQSMLPSLLFYVNEWLSTRRSIVISARITDVVLRLFYEQIMAQPSLKALLESIQQLERKTLKSLKDIIGFNNAAIDYLAARTS
jgi:U3 small nucleolar RNA-associated protein 12